MRQTVNLVSNESQKLMVIFFWKIIEPIITIFFLSILTSDAIHGWFYAYGIQDRAATAEKRFQKGWNTLRHLTLSTRLSFISFLIALI